MYPQVDSINYPPYGSRLRSKARHRPKEAPADSYAAYCVDDKTDLEVLHKIHPACDKRTMHNQILKSRPIKSLEKFSSGEFTALLQ
jgi:hypothetical protein